MNKSEKFRQVFGIYAEEFWAKPEREMLEWIAEEAEERTAKVDGNRCTACDNHIRPCMRYCDHCGARLEWE